MNEFSITEEEMLTQRLRHARCDCLVLTDYLEYLAESDPGKTPQGRMDRLYGVAHLVALVAQNLDAHVLS
jgi:hypothetical protein